MSRLKRRLLFWEWVLSQLTTSRIILFSLEWIHSWSNILHSDHKNCYGASIKMKHFWKPKKWHNLHYAFTAMTKNMCGLWSLKRATTNAQTEVWNAQRVTKTVKSRLDCIISTLELCSCQSNSRNKYGILTDINCFFYSRECIFRMKTI